MFFIITLDCFISHSIHRNVFYHSFGVRDFHWIHGGAVFHSDPGFDRVLSKLYHSSPSFYIMAIPTVP